MKRILVPFILAILATVSCESLDPFLYRVAMFGYPQSDGSFLADDGVKYVFSSGEIESTPRAFAVLDVTKEFDDGSKEARLVQYSIPLYKEPVVVTSVEIPDTLGTSEVGVLDAFYSGGCLNMLNVISVRSEGGDNHHINLMVDAREVSDTLRLVLKHRASWGTGDQHSHKDFRFYSSFPIESLLPEKDSVIVKLSWEWEEEAGSMVSKVAK